MLHQYYYNTVMLTPDVHFLLDKLTMLPIIPLNKHTKFNKMECPVRTGAQLVEVNVWRVYSYKNEYSWSPYSLL